MPALYKIVSVDDAGFMVVEWQNGPKISYPIPHDDAGNVLDQDAMEDYLADQYIGDIKKRERPAARLNALKGLMRGPGDQFVNIAAKVAARR